MKKTSIFITLLGALFILTLFTGCATQESSNDGIWAAIMAISGPNIYSAGNYNDGSNIVPCYWINNTKYDLPRLNNGYANSIYVSEGTVYTAGYYNTGSLDIACIWKGNTKIDLSDTTDGRALSISIYGGIAYVVGYWNTGSGGKDVPRYWTYSGSTLSGPFSLTHSGGSGYAHNARATSIYINGAGSIYISGYYNDGSIDIPCYWPGLLSDGVDLLGGGGRSAYTFGITYSEPDIYTTGSYNNGSKHVACYWENTTKTDLNVVDAAAGRDTANSIFVSSGTIYTAGYFHNGIDTYPCYWIDTALKGLGSFKGRANSIFVYGSDVYSGGYYYDSIGMPTPCVWKNSSVFLTPDRVAGKDAYINSIYILP